MSNCYVCPITMSDVASEENVLIAVQTWQHTHNLYRLVQALEAFYSVPRLDKAQHMMYPMEADAGWSSG
jgi:hypothetical protein